MRTGSVFYQNFSSAPRLASLLKTGKAFRRALGFERRGAALRGSSSTVESATSGWGPCSWLVAQLAHHQQRELLEQLDAVSGAIRARDCCRQRRTEFHLQQLLGLVELTAPNCGNHSLLIAQILDQYREFMPSNQTMSHAKVPAKSNRLNQPMYSTCRSCLLLAVLVAFVGCQSAGSGGAQATGGAFETGGAQATGGIIGSGGEQSTGGVIGTGGTRATGGTPGTGGAQSAGGGLGSGGALGNGGKLGSGGAVGTGGSGGTPGTGGTQGALDASQDTAVHWLVHVGASVSATAQGPPGAKDFYLVNVRSPTAPDIAGTDLDLQTSTDVTPTVTAIENLVNHNLCADIVVYCVTGGTSQRVGTQLISDGYLKVRDLQGGITAWQAQGFPVVQAGGGPG
jgi:rhodanese-related sulfurtransferase